MFFALEVLGAGDDEGLFESIPDQANQESSEVLLRDPNFALERN